MGWIVYKKSTGELLRYYNQKSSAQAQVTGHNRREIMSALRGIPRVTEWSLCEWQEYEGIFAKYYAQNKDYMLRSSSY
jgi:hypothetical protein